MQSLWSWPIEPCHRGMAKQKGLREEVPTRSHLLEHPHPLQGGGKRPDICQSLLGLVCLSCLRVLVPFPPLQGDAPCLPLLVFWDRTPPAWAAQHGRATLGSACPGLPCGGEPDGQRCLAELPPSSLPSHSHSCLGRCPCPVLLSGPGPVQRFQAPAGQVSSTALCLSGPAVLGFD